MTNPALILIGHGARDPEWAEPMRRVRQAIVERLPTLRVELAFMELMRPDIDECADRLVNEGAARILVLPLFLARGGHVTRDLPQQIASLRERHRGVRFELAAPVGEVETVLRAMAEHALSLLADPSA